MAEKQLARGMWVGFARTENPFGTPNGMDENLRTIDDHIAPYTLAAPMSVGTMPPAPDAGDGQIFTDGSYAIYNDGGWRFYGARAGISFMKKDGTEVWQNTGNGWRKASVLDVQPAIDAAQAAVKPLADAAAENADRAEVASNAAQLSAGIFPTSAAGISATASGAYFSVPATDSKDYLVLYRNDDGNAVEIKRYPSSEIVSVIDGRTQDIDNRTQNIMRSRPSSATVFSVADENGNSPLSVSEEGVVSAPSLTSQDIAADVVRPGAVLFGNQELSSLEAVGFVLAVIDVNGWLAFGVTEDGSLFGEGLNSTAWHELTIGTDDTIVHIGDSYTASHYVLKDKAYISQLAALSPYRHQNFGVSGNDALDMQYRIVNQSLFDGVGFDAMKGRYAFITTLTNDGQFRNADLTYYAENVRRLVETVRATGTEPVVTTEFPATATENALLRRIADESGCAFIDCTVLDAEIGGLDLGPFHQGHPGTRTGGVFWLPMLDFIDRMPKPDRAVKIFRRRSTFAIGGIADLLYKDRIDRNKKWKEISVAHYLLNDPNKFEELSQLGTFGYNWQGDEYQDIAAGTPVAFTDYALVEVTLPGTAATLDAAELTLTVSGAPTVYVRNFLDVPASMPGRVQGSTPTAPTYLSKWDKSRGAWRSFGAYSTPITITQADLKYSMQGDKLVVMIAGDFSLSGLKVRYRGREVKSDLRPRMNPTIIGDDLLEHPLCGTSEQLSHWTQTGAPSLIVPIDVSNAPRKPDTNTHVDGVCVISSDNSIGQTITLPATNGRTRNYLLTVWARYFPKAFLNPALYPGLDVAQIVDRIANPEASPITSDTHDLRTLKCEVWTGVAYPINGGAEFVDFAPLQWRPVRFVVELVPYRTGTALSFRLSCPDGEIQIAKASFHEVI